MAIRDIQSADFDAVVAGSPWAIVCFTRPKCPWCARVAEPLAELAATVSDNVAVVKIDREASPELAQRFSVRSFPVLILFKNGSIREASAGGGDNTLEWIESLKELAEA
ncbi:MAG TPA: thioredoxin family protein [Vitreimonas sp.]|jgi:thioredoxin 2|nr:thioredoxin family protein [Vitreimonas sp.]